MKTKSALSYFGSDSEVANDLATLLDGCKHVTIPFCGGLSILPHLTARAIVANDLNDLAIHFYRVASGCLGAAVRDTLFARCNHTLSHPSELKLAEQYLTGADDSLKAWAYWAVCWLSRKGQAGTVNEGKGLPSIRWTADGGTNASRIRAASDDLPAWAKHFERCEWLCEDFRKILAKVKDQAGCGVYCDPPWRGLGGSYTHSFTDNDHTHLRNDLQRFDAATVVVRYGDEPFIRDLYADARFVIIEAESRTQSNAVKGEIWITNQPIRDKHNG